MDLFNRYQRDEEDRYGSGGSSISGLDTGTSSLTYQPDVYERNLVERILAPLEAPQQFLFGATKNVADDGFQTNDITKALGHSFRYANPWNNVRPVDASEIRNTFFGERSERWNKYGKFSANLGISLLYDPLLLAAPAKIAKLTKADEAIGAMKYGVRNLIDRHMPEPVKNLGEDIVRNFFNKNAGLPKGFINETEAFRQNVNKWRISAYQMFKKAENLGSPEAVKLVTEGLEDEAVWLARTRGDMQGRTITELRDKLDAIGMDEANFWDIYDRARNLDDAIGESLVKTGVINIGAFQEMKGKHLRRMYAAWDNPQESIKRLEDIATEGGEKFSLNNFRNNMVKFKKDLDESAFAAPRDVGGGRQTFLFDQTDKFTTDPLKVERYFKVDGNPEFNLDNFTTDVDTFVRSNPEVAPEEILRQVKEDMLQGVNVPGDVYASVLNHIQGSYVDYTKEANYFVDLLKQRMYNPAFNWRSMQERTQLVNGRRDIPEEIRTALGEITSFGPRVAEQAAQVGRLAETRKYFDNLAGVKRNGVGEITEKAGSDFASKVANPAKGHTVVLQGDRFGELEGMYTTPAISKYLNRMEGAQKLTDPTQQIAQQVGEGVKELNSRFKKAKIVLDPVSQARNALGDLVFMDLQGVLPWSVGTWGKTLNEMKQFSKTGEVGKYLDLAEKSGLDVFGSTFSAAELNAIGAGLKDMRIKDADGAMETTRNLFSGLGDLWNAMEEPAVRAMEVRERMFKMYSFINKYDELAAKANAKGTLTPEMQKRIGIQAKEITEGALFNYNELPFAWDFARKYGLMPFVSYPVKAIPSLMKTLVERPARVLKYPRTVEAWNEAVTDDTPMGGNSNQVAKEIAALPDYVRDSLVVKMPFDDDEGRPLYFDAGYLLPWYLIKDIKDSLPGQGEGQEVIGRTSMFVSPLLNETISLMTNKDSFNRDIVTPGMSTTEKMGAWAKNVYQFFMPSVVPFGNRAESYGKTLLSYTSNKPEPKDWEKTLATAAGIYGGVAPTDSWRAGFTSQTQAQAAISPTNPGDYLGGQAMGLFGGLKASDPDQAALNELAGAQSTASDIQKEISRIKRNPRMRPEEKRDRILKLVQQMTEAQLDAAENIQEMR